MRPKVEKIYNKIYYSKPFEDAAKTTCDYKYDDVAK